MNRRNKLPTMCSPIITLNNVCYNNTSLESFRNVRNNTMFNRFLCWLLMEWEAFRQLSAPDCLAGAMVIELLRFLFGGLR